MVWQAFRAPRLPRWCASPEPRCTLPGLRFSPWVQIQALRPPPRPTISRSVRMPEPFIHGVLNTDNMSLLHESFDQGPFPCRERWVPEFTAACFDHSGLYAEGRQPLICRHNLRPLRWALCRAIPPPPCRIWCSPSWSTCRLARSLRQLLRRTRRSGGPGGPARLRREPAPLPGVGAGAPPGPNGWPATLSDSVGVRPPCVRR
jgi:hypothetical protein